MEKIDIEKLGWELIFNGNQMGEFFNTHKASKELAEKINEIVEYLEKVPQIGEPLKGNQAKVEE